MPAEIILILRTEKGIQDIWTLGPDYPLTSIEPEPKFMKMYSRIQSLCTFNLYTIRRKSKKIEWDVLGSFSTLIVIDARL